MALYSYKDVARKPLPSGRTFPLKEATVRIYVSRGLLPYYKIGKRVYFAPEELDRWIDERHVPVRDGAR